jgi:MFS family permease
MFLLSRWSGGLLDRYGARLPLIVGPLTAAAGFALLASAGIGGSYVTSFLLPVVVLGIGMAISVAPLTTTVMNAVDQSHAGAASGINNAVSRVASLLAVAVFGGLMSYVFAGALESRLQSLAIDPKMRTQIVAQKSRLAAAETNDPQGREAIDEAFIAGYRVVLLVATGLAIASAISAAALIASPKPTAHPND